MKTTLAVCLVLVSTTLSAQYGPPAKDLDEAQFFMREIQRQIEPAVTEARDRAVVLGILTRAQNKLIGKEPASEISDAIRAIDDFLYRREQSGKELSRENLKTLAAVRKELEIQQPPYAVLALRERLHHEFVHPLESQSLKDLQAIERLQMEWEAFIERHVKPLDREVMSAVTTSIKEPGQ